MTLNLSCGKCKAIRPFSGTPPTCEVCGWVCSTTNMRASVADVTPTRQNLSCGKCKIIRSFSGMPPTCETCGWVYSTTNIRALAGSKPATNSNSKSTNASGTLFFLLLVLGSLAFVFSRAFPEAWYAFTNGTDIDLVHVQSEPHDCDFSKAPLGDKECHFEKHVETQKDPKTGKVSVYVYWNKVEGN
jgi:hypothetical protein